MALIPRITELLRERGAEDILVLAGGVIPAGDAEILVAEHSVARVFGPGTDTRDIVSYIRERKESA
jgi:methylmalonyl-CoA mutase C-terminal domain/subunit